jgi:tRNA-2-methylthio-N6-dimethylallyladenosine synthase
MKTSLFIGYIGFMTYNIITIGCQMNKADSERLSFYLEKIGFSLKKDFLSADLVVIVTCGVRQTAEDRLYGLVERISRNNKKSKVFVSGCLSDRPDVEKRLKGKVSCFFNISDLVFLDEELKKYFPETKKFSKEKIENYLEIKAKMSSNFSAFVPIGNGCDNFCSYCVVPYARGREIYRPIKEIVQEAEHLVKRGYKEIILIAQNVNSYSSAKNDFADLLKKVNDIKGDFWIRFATSHPKDVSSKLLKTLKHLPKVCEHFHLALQSGDDEILKAMNRKYSASSYEKLVSKIRRALDRGNGLPVAITTDIVVGFPLETRKKFLETKKLLGRLNLDLAYIAKYSPRYGTASSKLEDDVSPQEKKKRELELNNLVKKSALRNNREYIGKEVRVLVEGIDRKGDLFGKTRTSKIVRILNVSDKDKLIGEFVDLEILAASEFELKGKVVEKKPKLVVILGPTSSGKTSLAVKAAYHFDGEIVSADSRQVYRGMDVGTGKDLGEYSFQGKKIPYHLIDVASPKTTFSLAKYQARAFKAIDSVIEKGKLPILVGGSGLYLEAVVDNYILSTTKTSFEKRKEYEKLNLKDLQDKIKKVNPKFFRKLNSSEQKNKRRLARYLEILLSEKDFLARKGEPRYDFLILGLKVEREEIKRRIYKRLVDRIEKEDMIDEAKKLRKDGVSFRKLERFGLEYKHLSFYLQNKISREDLIDKLFIAICQFSKRQMSWFRRWERLGAKINWIKSWRELKSSIEKYLSDK